MITEDKLILVDLQDRAIGTAPKMQTHEQALLHRAFSVFLFNGEQLLVQRRAAGKYHCGGLWANTCCSHPRVGEELLSAAKRRLREEAGVECELRDAGSFVYCAPFANGLTEYELDHVLVGEYAGPFTANPEEVDEMKYISLPALEKDILAHPERYAPWFFTALPIALEGRKRTITK